MQRLKRIPYFITIGIFIIISLFPFLWAFSISIKPKEMATMLPPVLIFKPTIVSYIELFKQYHFEKYLVNSLTISIGVLLVSLLVGSLAAFSFARYRVGGRSLTYGILVVQMIPPMVITFPLYLTIRALGLIDSIPGLILAQLTYSLPFVMWVMRQFFMQVPIELDESAKIDGASNYRLFFQIIIPLSIPGLVSASIFTFLGSWNDLLFPLMLTNVNAQTVTIAAANFVTVYNILWTDVDASALLMTIPPILLTLFARKYIVAGLVGSSVKG
ncbi:MAG TPA: carbohydrate ABC transporter permease [Ruminiclostridium sp.]